MALLTNNKRVLTSSVGEKLTDELYSELKPANQLLCMIAESLNIVPMVADYEGNKYLTKDTIFAIYSALK